MERYTKRMTDCWIKTKSGKDYTNKTQDYDAMLKLRDIKCKLGEPRVLDTCKNT